MNSADAPAKTNTSESSAIHVSAATLTNHKYLDEAAEGALGVERPPEEESASLGSTTIGDASTESGLV